MKIIAIFGIAWATAIVGWFVAMAVTRSIIRFREWRQAGRVVKGAEEYLKSLPTFTTDPETWPNAQCDRPIRILWVRPIVWDDETR